MVSTNSTDDTEANAPAPRFAHPAIFNSQFSIQPPLATTAPKSYLSAMSDLQARLQSAVGDTYRIEEELGGGGMSRVFLAEEVALGRKVVIKVLPPEMAAEVSKDRFQREIQLAAKLQHPHVVPLLTTGAGDDLLYYVMPYIEGESLRSKLHREGELPVGEAVRILKEVVDALAYAHEQGVVHRDIKPDNVMISRRHALVTDFGVAKAVTVSGSSSSLTSLGMALGTPAYMAPEQAAADPHTDHRADIYAVGTLAYEMLTGEPPFTGPTPQAVMVKHVTEAPQAVTTRRPAVSEALGSLVMRCLEKRPADRWQAAAELLPQLEALTTPSGGVTPTGTLPLEATSAATMLQRSAPARVAGLFGLSAVALLAVTYILVMQLGLPYWVLSTAVVLLAVSLPIVMFTGRAERRRASAKLTGVVADETGTTSGRWLTWRRTMLGTGVALALLVVVTASYMAMRALGIGPAGTLVASGEIERGALVILSDFTDNAGDPGLALTVTDAFAIDLGQSDILRLMQPGDVQNALQRMTLDPTTPLEPDVALEMAVREGAGAVIAGDVNRAGGGYVLSARLLAPETGNVIEAFRETANDDFELIGAIDRLSKGFRERLGESLRSLRASAPLGYATTSSVQALRKYTQGARLANVEANSSGAIELLEEAIALDTTFASAYRKLANTLANQGRDVTRRNAAFTKAFQLRERLTPFERAVVTASYYARVEGDNESAAYTLRSYYEDHPEHWGVLNNLGVYIEGMRRWEEAEAMYSLLIDSGSVLVLAHSNLVRVQIAQGKFEAATRSTDRLAENFPGRAAFFSRIGLASARGDYSEALRLIRLGRETYPGDPEVRALSSRWIMRLDLLLGRIGEAEELGRDWQQLEAERDRPVEYINATIDLVHLSSQFRGDEQGAIEIVNEALNRFPLDSLPAADRPYLNLARFYAEGIHRPDLAREVMAEYESEVDPVVRNTQSLRLGVAGKIALAEGDAAEAIIQFRAWDAKITSPVLALPDLARAYDSAGVPDSAIAVYSRYMETPYLYRGYDVDSWNLAAAHKRLGELYEARGDREKAVEQYNAFVELWKDADPELQPQVEDVRTRIAKLVGEGR